MRVLVSVEDFESGCCIIDFLAVHIWKLLVEFKLLHVVELPVISECQLEHYGDDGLMHELKSKGNDLLLKIRDRFLSRLAHDICPRDADGSLAAKVEIEMEVRFGHPHHGILAAASEWNADLIVLGSHKKGPSLGSVSASVADRARCAVTVVPCDSHLLERLPATLSD